MVHSLDDQPEFIYEEGDDDIDEEILDTLLDTIDPDAEDQIAEEYLDSIDKEGPVVVSQLPEESFDQVIDSDNTSESQEDSTNDLPPHGNSRPKRIG